MKTEEFIKKWGITLTGGIASGKSFVADFLREKKLLVYDADILSRKVSKKGEACYQKIVETLGDSFLNENREINRFSLAKIIFSSPEKRKLLESIVHPAIGEELVKRLKKEGVFENPRYWFYEAALIFEKEKEAYFYENWLIYCSKETQLKRLKLRNPGQSSQFIESTLAAQKSVEDKKKKADFLIDTDESKNFVKDKIQKYLSLKGI